MTRGSLIEQDYKTKPHRDAFVRLLLNHLSAREVRKASKEDDFRGIDYYATFEPDLHVSYQVKVDLKWPRTGNIAIETSKAWPSGEGTPGGCLS